jgi:hypothetical protein
VGVDVEKHRKAAIARMTEGEAVSSVAARQEAFAGTGPAVIRGLIEKVVKHAYRITDEDVTAAKQQLSEDEIFELVACAAIGTADRQLAAARAAIAEVG